MQPINNEPPAVTGRTRDLVILLQKSILFLARYWFLMANLLAGAVLAMGFLAPALMSEGFTNAGQSVYRFLAPHNHQLPHRSYFLFGQSGSIQSYSLEQVLAFGASPQNLQAFVGNQEIGFKTALNHRMVAIFVALFFGGLGWGVARQRPKLSFIWFLVMTLPLLIDGFSHIISQNSSLGFRADNAWAVALTGGIFSDTFYTGSTIGSLNWLLRTVTGLLFGLGLAWFLYTYLSRRFLAIRVKLEPRLKKLGTLK